MDKKVWNDMLSHFIIISIYKKLPEHVDTSYIDSIIPRSYNLASGKKIWTDTKFEYPYDLEEYDSRSWMMSYANYVSKMFWNQVEQLDTGPMEAFIAKCKIQENGKPLIVWGYI